MSYLLRFRCFVGCKRRKVAFEMVCTRVYILLQIWLEIRCLELWYHSVGGVLLRRTTLQGETSVTIRQFLHNFFLNGAMNKGERERERHLSRCFYFENYNMGVSGAAWRIQNVLLKKRLSRAHFECSLFNCGSLLLLNNWTLNIFLILNWTRKIVYSNMENLRDDQIYGNLRKVVEAPLTKKLDALETRKKDTSRSGIYRKK